MTTTIFNTLENEMAIAFNFQGDKCRIVYNSAILESLDIELEIPAETTTDKAVLLFEDFLEHPELAFLVINDVARIPTGQMLKQVTNGYTLILEALEGAEHMDNYRPVKIHSFEGKPQPEKNSLSTISNDELCEIEFINHEK